MANEITITANATGLNLYALIWDMDGKIWNGTAFETYATANYANYDVALSELGTASRFYAANMPATVPVGEYRIWIRVNAGTPAETDTWAQIFPMFIAWDGDKMVGTEIDAHYAKAALLNKQTQTIATGVVVIRNNADDADLMTLTPSVDDADNPTTNTLTPS